jgi:hypothetical protein
MPGLPSHEFLTPIRNKRKVRARDLSDFEHTNFVSTYSQNNSRGFKVDNCKTTNYRHSFFIRTTIDWNNLDNDIVKCFRVETFMIAPHIRLGYVVPPYTASLTNHMKLLVMKLPDKNVSNWHSHTHTKSKLRYILIDHTFTDL